MKPETKEKPNVMLQSISVVIIVLFIIGFIIDAFSDFYLFNRSTFLYAGLAGIFLLAIFYLFGLAGTEWIHKKR